MDSNKLTPGNAHPSWRRKVKSLPDKPGVYLFKDQKGRVIYVGKAASLNKRAASYTRPAGDPKTEAMTAAAADLDFIVTDSELEALILENVLIKKEQPRYNIILRDDKNYPYLYLNLNEPFPRLQVVRRPGKKKEGFYFGPYVPAKALRSTLKLLGEVFPLRRCARLRARSRPCIYHQMRRCGAPCAQLIPEQKYNDLVNQLRLFLEGKTREVQKNLHRRMEECAAALQYEQAARLRDNLRAIQRVTERQKVISAGGGNEDVIGLALAPYSICFVVLFIRRGMIIGHKDLLMEGEGEKETAALLASFIEQFYAPGGPRTPPRLVLPYVPAQEKLLGQWLSEQRGGPVELHTPRRGKKRQLVDLAIENARTVLQQHQPEQEKSLAAIRELQQALGLSHPPRHIEGFDISNIQGQEAVGSIVVWRFPGLYKQGYRHFKIKTVSGIDDCAMLAEIVWRRYKRPGAKEADLLLIDGGKGQVNAARKVLKELGLFIPLIGLAKKEEEIYFPRTPLSLKLPASSGALRLLQRIRDEAHRFAITHHRKRRGKAALHSPLDDIPGVGPQRKKALLAHFGSLEKIETASLEELLGLPFLPPETARNIYEFWRREYS